MCEVTAANFKKVLPELEAALRGARFVALDTEFSYLSASNSLFDSASERYAKMRSTVEQMTPLQVGLAPFSFDRDTNSYVGHVYTFYVFPQPFSHMTREFLCQASSLQFLRMHSFDFNKLISEGVPYLNRSQETRLRREISNVTLTDNSLNMVLEENKTAVIEWIMKAKTGDTKILENMRPFKYHLVLKFVLHKYLRNVFKNLWTFEDVEGFRVVKVTIEKKKVFLESDNLEETFISDLVGFSKVFRLLTSLKIPVVGHNLVLDLMVMIHSFEDPLPKTYKAFKKLAHSLLPQVYDTKSISFNITSFIPENKGWEGNTLENLYRYFKDGAGRHLAPNSPLIEPTIRGEQIFHNAGWDSYCTGYIFIRMAHVFAAQPYKDVKGKKFMSSELLQAISRFRNNINIIRGDISNIQLDGEDPPSRRPPRLIVKSIRNRQIDINQVTSLLSAYGFVEVRAYSRRGRRAIVAVDNFGSAKRILRQFKCNSEFHIQQYSVLKHSPIAGAMLWGSACISGLLLAWYGFLRSK